MMKLEDVFDEPLMVLEEFGLSVGMATILGNNGVRKIGNLRGRTERNLMRLKGVNSKTVEELRKALQLYVSDKERTLEK